MFGIQQKVADTAKRAGFLSGGLLMCVVGTGFLTVAGWLALVPVVGTMTTAAIIAGVYLGVGLILLGLGAKSGSPAQAPVAAPVADQPQAADGPPILQAFMYGLQAGSKAEKARR